MALVYGDGGKMKGAMSRELRMVQMVESRRVVGLMNLYMRWIHGLD
jgi:hypothetical protein